MQGLFGVFPFTVSDSEVCTFRDLKKSRELAYVEHKTLDGLGLSLIHISEPTRPY